MTTIVSAYINLNRESALIKSKSDYLKHCLPLLNYDHPKIIFLEPEIIELLPTCHESTKIIPFHKEELFFKTSMLKLPSGININKDTHDYFSIQLNKTDWIMKAHRLFPENKQFVWVDFGISHVCKNPNFSLLNKEYDKIRIPGCLVPKKDISISFEIPNWYFCGGLFGGNIEKLIVFDFLVKKYTKRIIDKGNITWEINVWFEIYKEFPELFDWYYSDHNDGMINNY